MSDDRSSGFFGGSGFVRFNSADNSGSASRIPDKKRSKSQHQEEDEDDNQKDNSEELRESEYVDRSAQLNATLNSLAMLNVASVIKDKNQSKNLDKTKQPNTEKIDS